MPPPDDAAIIHQNIPPPDFISPLVKVSTSFREQTAFAGIKYSNQISREPGRIKPSCANHSRLAPISRPFESGNFLSLLLLLSCALLGVCHFQTLFQTQFFFCFTIRYDAIRCDAIRHSIRTLISMNFPFKHRSRKSCFISPILIAPYSATIGRGCLGWSEMVGLVGVGRGWSGMVGVGRGCLGWSEMVGDVKEWSVLVGVSRCWSV